MPQSNAAPSIGHNRSPFDLIAEKIDNLYGEAKLWLDGAAVENQGQADDLKTLEDEIKKAKTKAEDLRKEEVKPFDDGKAAVQAKFAPLIADNKSTKGKAILALDAIKKALTPWNAKVLAEKEEKARKLREEADAKAAAAEAAMQLSAPDNLEEREKAEALVTEAKAAEKVASKAAKIGPTGLRRNYVPVLTNRAAAARHYWETKTAEFDDFLLGLARNDVRAGKREIPGFDVREERTAT